MTILSGSTDNRWPVAMRLCTPMKGEQLLIYRSSPSATALIYFKDACETFSEKSTVTFLRSQKINKKIFLLNQSPKPTLKRVSTEAVSTDVCKELAYHLGLLTPSMRLKLVFWKNHQHTLI